MMSLKEYIAEMSIAGEGDWDHPKTFSFPTLSQIVLEKNYIKQPYIHQVGNTKFFLYKLRTSDTFILVSFDDGKPLVSFRVDLSSFFDISGYGRIRREVGVITDKSYQGFGLATFVYKTLVNDLGFTIIGDTIQYFGARKLWAKLSKTVMDVEVDLYDSENDEVFITSVTLHHGNIDADFDKILWSYSNDKRHIFPILRKVFW